MPRGRDECWEEVLREPAEAGSGKRHPRVTCRHCGTTWTSNEKGRVVEHLQRCAALPIAQWATYQPHRLSSDVSLPSSTVVLQSQQQPQQQPQQRPPSTLPPSPLPPRQTQTPQQSQQTRQQQQQQQHPRPAQQRVIRPPSTNATTVQDAATLACAHWLQSAGLDAEVLAHPAFAAFVHALRPDYVVPDRQMLALARVDAPLGLIAHLADPQGRQRCPRMLDGNETAQARALQAFVLLYCGDDGGRATALLGMLSLLRARQGPFANEQVWHAGGGGGGEGASALQWWQRFWLAEHQGVAELCMLALAVAPQGDGDEVEREWSPDRLVRVLQRQRVDPSASGRIMAAFWSLRMRRGWIDNND